MITWCQRNKLNQVRFLPTTTLTWTDAVLWLLLSAKSFSFSMICTKSFPKEVLWVFTSSLMCLSEGYSPGAVMMLFVLLCMESIASCAPAVSLCIQSNDQKRQTASVYSPVHSKHSNVWPTESLLSHAKWLEGKFCKLFLEIHSNYDILEWTLRTNLCKPSTKPSQSNLKAGADPPGVQRKEENSCFRLKPHFF